MWVSRALAALLCLAATGCAGVAWNWTRADGQPLDRNQFDVAEAICRMDAREAAQAKTADAADFIIAPTHQDLTVYNSCMAQQGYVAAR